MENKRIARLAREGFLNEPLFKGFTDIRKKPQIKLQAILTSLFLMPFFATASLLSNDRQARTAAYKKLFGSQRKMVASDSTLARVLRWLKAEQVKAFLQSFLAQFEKRDLLRKRLGACRTLAAAERRCGGRVAAVREVRGPERCSRALSAHGAMGEQGSPVTSCRSHVLANRHIRFML